MHDETFAVMAKLPFGLSIMLVPERRDVAV